MTDKELRHLNRGELLQMLIAQGEENRKLREQLEEANKKLEQREIVLANAGSIAEAALQLNGVFEAAQKAAQQYLDSVKSSTGGTGSLELELPVSSKDTPVFEQPVSPCVKTEDMSSDDYWKQVQKRAQLILGNQE